MRERERESSVQNQKSNQIKWIRGHKKHIQTHTRTQKENLMEIKQTNKREKKAKEIYEVLPLLFDHKIIIIGKKEGERAKDLMMMMMIFVRENIKKKMKKIIVYHTHTHTLFLCPNKQTKKCNS